MDMENFNFDNFIYIYLNQHIPKISNILTIITARRRHSVAFGIVNQV